MFSQRTKEEVARENGAKSHGPVTPEGKARSSQNAATHSLSTCNVVCLTHEDQQRYDEHHLSYTNVWKPVNIIEVDLVEEMAASKWQERRCQAIETALMDFQIQMQQTGELKDHIDQLSNTQRIALAFMDLADHSKTLQLLLRYRSEHNRRYHRAMRQLVALRSKGVFETQARTEKRNEPTVASNTNKANHQTPPEAEPRPSTEPVPAGQNAPNTAEPRIFRTAAA